MYIQYFKIQLKTTYGKTEYHEIYKWLEINENKILYIITKSLNWKMYTILSKNKYIKNIYPMLGLIKSILINRWNNQYRA